jgi:hypothetical protein
VAARLLAAPASRDEERGAPGLRRFYFDLRIGPSVVRDDIGALSESAEAALADAAEASEELGRASRTGDRQIDVDEIIVRDDNGREVGRIDLSHWRRP